MASEQRATFGDLLHRARRNAGLTQEELAERSGVSARTVSNLERGINQTPHRDTLNMLAQALELHDSERQAWDRARKHPASHAPSRRPQDPGHSMVHLPTPLTSFVGRQEEIERVVNLLLLPETRLLTLTGPGGMGKTRLSVEVARQVEDEYPGGIWFVDLSPLNDHRLVLPTVATALNVALPTNEPVLAALAEVLADTHTLLLLDNLEHVLGAALQVRDLIRACPDLTVLATSRVPVRVQGEREFPVPAMGLREVGEQSDCGERPQSEAVSLFMQRAQAVRPDFALPDGNAQVIQAICQRLDGMPLAIELAAARIRHLSPQAILRRLDHPLPLLTDGSIDLPVRQQTLRHTIAWSYDLLRPESQRLFRYLSVFRGGWTLEAAEAVSGDGNVAGQLERLVEHNLIQVHEQPDGEPRYSMLETMREFGLERLDEDAEDVQARTRHGHFFLELVEEISPSWRTTEQTREFGRLESELDNLREALSWFMGHDGELACRLSGALWRFFVTYGHEIEGRTWLETSLGQAPPLSPAVRASVLEGIGVLAYFMSDYDVTEACFEEALPLWEAVGDLNGIASSHHLLGRVSFETGDYSTAEHHYRKSLAISRRLGDPVGIAEMLNVLGVIASARGEHDRERALYEESLELRRKAGDQFGIQQSLSNLGELARDAGDYDRARALFEESLAIGLKHHLHDVEAQMLRLLGTLALLQGDYQRATILLTESIQLLHGNRSSRWVVLCLMSFAELAGLNGQPARAATIGGAVELILDRKNMHIPHGERAAYDRAIADARSTLMEDAWFTAWSRGRAMSSDDIVAFVVRGDERGRD